MFKFIKKLITNFKAACQRFREEMEIYNWDINFYSDSLNDSIYDSIPIHIFLNGHNIFAGNARDLLLKQSFDSVDYSYRDISMLKVYIYVALLLSNKDGIECFINSDKWKIVHTRWYLRDLFNI